MEKFRGWLALPAAGTLVFSKWPILYRIVAIPQVGASAGGSVGMDLDKAADFGSNLMQKTVDTLFNLVVPQNTPVTPPQVVKP
jgi:hypothetical protein